MTRKKNSKKTKQPEPTADEAPAAGTEVSEVEALRAERDNLLGRLQRVSADFLNYQKRVQRDVAEASQFANAELMKELLGVLDDMERALAAARANHSEDDPLLAGMQLVYDKALEILGRFGLEPIKAQGQPFDPIRHEAMMQQPSDQHQTPTVLGELQRGYELRGRVLRPARVIVSAAAEKPPGPDDEQEPSQ